MLLFSPTCRFFMDFAVWMRNRWRETGLLDSRLSAVIVFAFTVVRPLPAQCDHRAGFGVRRRPRVLMRLSMMRQFSVFRHARIAYLCVRQSP